MSDRTEYTIHAGQADLTASGEKKPCLVMIRGDFIGQVYHLNDETTLIGRSDDVDLTISDTSISRKHAQIVHRPDVFFSQTWVVQTVVSLIRILFPMPRC